MSQHYNLILKRTFNQVWDTLDDAARDIIANDTDCEHPTTKWFNNKVKEISKGKFENPDYWMNGWDWRTANWDAVCK